MVDWAYDVAGELCKWDRQCGNVDVREVAEALRRARADALEEAAHWLESVPQTLLNRQELAAHIRCLKDREP